MSASFKAKYSSRCGACRYEVAPGDMMQVIDNATYHERCAADVADGHIVQWITAESMARSDYEEREMARIAPIGKQGTCPTCRLELPASGICDDHGRPA